MKNIFSAYLIIKPIYKFRLPERIEKGNHNYIKCIKFNYISGLYGKLRYALLKHCINLILCPTRKIKEYICTEIDPISKDETGGVCIIPIRTNKNNANDYIGIMKSKFKERIKEHTAVIRFCRQSTVLSRLIYKQNVVIYFGQVKFIYLTLNYYTS